MGILADKVAVITGAAGGLGSAYARRFAEEGAKVLLNDMNADALTAVADELAAAGADVATCVASVADFDASAAMIDQAVERFGDLDIVVNNAGFLRDKMSFSMSEEEFDSVVAVHLKGHWAPSRHAAVYWRDQAKAGVTANRRLIHTASESGLFGSAGQTNYTAAKGGILTMSIAFARELEKYGVTSNTIAPRARTGMTSYNPTFAPPEDPDAFDRYDPANVAPFVTWLAGDASQHINGQAFIVAMNGVWLCKRWHVVAELVGEGRFSIEEIDERAAELFTSEDPGIPEFDPPGYGPRSGAKNK